MEEEKKKDFRRGEIQVKTQPCVSLLQKWPLNGGEIEKIRNKGWWHQPRWWTQNMEKEKREKRGTNGIPRKKKGSKTEKKLEAFRNWKGYKELSCQRSGVLILVMGGSKPYQVDRKRMKVNVKWGVGCHTGKNFGIWWKKSPHQRNHGRLKIAELDEAKK